MLLLFVVVVVVELNRSLVRACRVAQLNSRTLYRGAYRQQPLHMGPDVLVRLSRQRQLVQVHGVLCLQGPSATTHRGPHRIGRRLGHQRANPSGTYTLP